VSTLHQETLFKEEAFKREEEIKLSVIEE